MAVNKKNWFKLAGARLASDTPKFFKKIMVFMGTLGGLSVSLLLLKDTLPLSFHDPIEKWAGYFAVAGVVGLFVSGTATKDKDLQEGRMPAKKK